jgi:hypothetical protein
LTNIAAEASSAAAASCSVLKVSILAVASSCLLVLSHGCSLALCNRHGCVHLVQWRQQQLVAPQASAAAMYSSSQPATARMRCLQHSRAFYRFNARSDAEKAAELC